MKLLQSISHYFGSFFVNRAKLKDEMTKMKIEALIKQDDFSQLNRGWKDEFLLLLIIFPMILMFIPHTQSFVLNGFIALEKVPEWYLYAVVLVFVDTFGFRSMLRKIIESRFK